MKGYVRIMEAVIAVVILLTFMLYLGAKVVMDSGKESPASLGYQALRELDQRGVLRPLAESMDYQSINSSVQISGWRHEIQVCADSCEGVLPDEENVWKSSYIIAGDTSYGTREIRLYMW